MKKEILVTCYVNPDLDGFACTFAYTYFLNQTGVKATPSISGKHHNEADYILSEYKLNFDTKERNPEEYENIILVDSSDLDGIDARIDPNKVIEIVDHRKINMAERFPNAKTQIEIVGAAATLIAEKFLDNNIRLPKNIATLVYGAILSNTLNFQAKVTTDRDKKIASLLKKENNFPDNFAHKMFLSKSNFSGDKLKQSLRNDFANFKSHNFGGKKIGIAQIETIDGLNIVQDRKAEIISEIKSIMADENLDIVFLTVIDLEANQNIFVSPNKEIEKFIEKVLKVKFVDNIAVRQGLIMRKEIVPLLKEEFI